jgi:hypothetical protein
MIQLEGLGAGLLDDVTECEPGFCRRSVQRRDHRYRDRVFGESDMFCLTIRSQRDSVEASSRPIRWSIEIQTTI